MKRFFTFLKTELKLSLRDMNMPIFAIIMPLVIFIILGIIYGTKPAYDGADYTFMEQSFGAVSAVAICASGLMGLPLAVPCISSNVLCPLQRCQLRHFCGECGCMVRFSLSLGAGHLPCSRPCPSVCWQAAWQRTPSRQASLPRFSISPC